EFNNLVIRTENGSPVYMRDIASVELGGENYNSSVTFNGQQGVFVSISVTPQANPLTVISAVKEVVPKIINALPPNLSAEIVYDATDYIRESIYEVFKTIFEATLIVIIVIYLFLGSFRAILIPVITIPLSLIGVCSLMLALGYSINLLTLLAMVLAIGLVVDDAIVVLENIHRHIEDGETPFNAALIGAREITLPVIGMTITLAAVYAPIGFIGGLTGALFKEFAFTLASAVIISGIIALTLSPMMCSKILAPRSKENRVEQWINHFFDRLQLAYQHSLQSLFNYRTLVVIFAILVFSSVFFLYSKTPKETAPDEDIGFFIVFGQAPEYASLNYLDAYSNEFDKIFTGYPEAQYYFLINTAGGAVGGNRTIGGIILKPWSQRDRSQKEMNPLLQAQVSEVAGIQSNVVIPSRLPGVGGGAPIQLMITSSGDYETIFQAAQDMVDAALKSGLFIFIKNNLNFERPQIQVNIDRNKAADLGITMENVGIALAQNLAEGYVNRFSVDGYSYRVIPQLLRKFRFNEQSLLDIYVKTASEEMVSLATIATVATQAQPNSRGQFQQLNSAEIIGSMAPGYTIGDAVEFFQKQATELLPEGVSYDYAGQTRQFVQEGNTLLIAFFFSIILIFLVLAAQYESYRDPFIILISVPMSICGALIPLNLGLATINIYTQVGLITLIGVISKHGILMVDFANSLQRTKGLSKTAAIIEASKIRLRPILMTTAAMVFGVMPLLIATGAGAASRFGIGLVIVSGLSIGTLFTLYVVPVMYTLLAKVHQHEIESVPEPSMTPEADNPG
ncbi:MAG: efflux RND transporter permease subunit, partial [Gammaproteobacteria bacterium]